MTIYEHELKNIYIGEYKGWTPWANTILYMPLDTVNGRTDIQWHSTVDVNNNITYWTFGWVDCASFPAASNYINVNDVAFPNQWTMLIWVNNINQKQSSIWRASGANAWLSYSSTQWYYVWENNTYFGKTATNHWYLIAYCNSSTAADKKQYIVDNWTITSISCNNNDNALNTTKNVILSDSNAYFNWYMSALIIEDRIWTEQEISDYYNQTKSNYWL